MRVFISHLVLFLVLFGCKAVSNGGVEDLNVIEKINNSWILASMKGIDVDVEFVERKPQLNINTSENKVTGYSGCNNYFGKISVEGDSIKIGPLGSTMMACPTMQAEYKYMKLLESVDGYDVGNSELTLLLDGEPVLVFTTP
jgi:heat shock protein HslJ